MLEIALGIALGYLIIALFPFLLVLILKSIPYILWGALILAAIFLIAMVFIELTLPQFLGVLSVALMFLYMLLNRK